MHDNRHSDINFIGIFLVVLMEEEKGEAIGPNGLYGKAKTAQKGK